MRLGNRRGARLGLGLATLGLALAILAPSARADAFHVIPKEVPARDVNTGGLYMMPPVPYGHYAKDKAGSLYGMAAGIHSCLSCLKLGNGLCGRCGGAGQGCGHCGGSGLGCGLFHRSPCGNAGCGDPICSSQGKHGLFGHKLFGKKCGLCGGLGCGLCSPQTMPSPQVAVAHHAPHPVSKVKPSYQAPTPQASGQSGCSLPGCGLGGKHKHKHGMAFGSLCGGCGGKGCGLCKGGLFKHGGDPCSSCGGAGCGLCKGTGLLGKLCGLCGGKGCRNCLGGALMDKVLHRNQIKYFVGPGGPVPITPGYVPYVNPVRSPRDYFAFPPFTQ